MKKEKNNSKVKYLNPPFAKHVFYEVLLLATLEHLDCNGKGNICAELHPLERIESRFMYFNVAHSSAIK